MEKLSEVWIVFTPRDFVHAEATGDAERYLREHPNAEIVGGVPGIDRHLIEFADWVPADKRVYLNPYTRG